VIRAAEESTRHSGSPQPQQQLQPISDHRHRPSHPSISEVAECVVQFSCLALSPRCTHDPPPISEDATLVTLSVLSRPFCSVLYISPSLAFVVLSCFTSLGATCSKLPPAFALIIPTSSSWLLLLPVSTVLTSLLKLGNISFGSYHIPPYTHITSTYDIFTRFPSHAHRSSWRLRADDCEPSR
jgi:hypothetical protein